MIHEKLLHLFSLSTWKNMVKGTIKFKRWWTQMTFMIFHDVPTKLCMRPHISKTWSNWIWVVFSLSICRCKALIWDTLCENDLIFYLKVVPKWGIAALLCHTNTSATLEAHSRRLVLVLSFSNLFTPSHLKEKKCVLDSSPLFCCKLGLLGTLKSHWSTGGIL